MRSEQEQRLLNKLERLARSGKTSDSTFVADELERFYKNRLKDLDVQQMDKERLNMKLEIIRKIGDVHMMTGRLDKANEYYGQVIAMGPRSVSTAGVYRRYGDNEKMKANWEGAGRHYEKALEISEKNKDQIGKGLSLRNIGYISWRKGHFDIALDYYKKALRIFEKEEVEEEIAITNIAIGNVLLERGEFRKAIGHYRRSYDLLKNTDNAWQMARINNNLGHALVNIKEYKEAIVHFKNAIKIGNRIDEKFWAGWGYFQLAECYVQLDDMKKARETCAEAMEVLTVIDDKLGLAKAHYSLGLIHWTEGEEEQAFKEFETCINGLEDLGVPSAMAYYMYHYGLILMDSDQKKKAHKMLIKAMQTFKKIGAKVYVDKVNKAIGKGK